MRTPSSPDFCEWFTGFANLTLPSILQSLVNKCSSQSSVEPEFVTNDSKNVVRIPAIKERLPDHGSNFSLPRELRMLFLRIHLFQHLNQIPEWDPHRSCLLLLPEGVAIQQEHCSVFAHFLSRGTKRFSPAGRPEPVCPGPQLLRTEGDWDRVPSSMLLLPWFFLLRPVCCQLLVLQESFLSYILFLLSPAGKLDKSSSQDKSRL